MPLQERSFRKAYVYAYDFFYSLVAQMNGYTNRCSTKPAVRVRESSASCLKFPSSDLRVQKTSDQPAEGAAKAHGLVVVILRGDVDVDPGKFRPRWRFFTRTTTCSHLANLKVL